MKMWLDDQRVATKLATVKFRIRRHSWYGSAVFSTSALFPPYAINWHLLRAIKRAAKRFFRKMLKTAKRQSPRVINVDKNQAYPPAIEELKNEGVLAATSQLRQCKYLNNILEQDHRFIKRRVNPGLGFSSFKTAHRTIKGYEAMNMIRKGQIEGVGRKDIGGQVGFVAGLFRIAA